MIQIPAACTGCSACISVCPVQCIMPRTDSKGFMTPTVDASRCIQCGRCDKVCPVYIKQPAAPVTKILAGQNADREILKKSSSGGIFYLLAAGVLKRGGVVYGVKVDYDDNGKIRHTRCADAESLGPILGSKYVQSDILGIYNAVKTDLQSGAEVLFSGTPCQVAGLKNYLGREYLNLLAVDIICFGVPSPEIFRKYLDEQLAGPNGSRRLTSLNFRDKRDGWFNYGMSLTVEAPNGDGESASRFIKRTENPFMRAFVDSLSLRDCCYECPVKNFTSRSDLTLGDAWRIERYLPAVDTEAGYSIAVPHTQRGEAMLESLNVKWTPVPREMLVKYNESAFKSPKKTRKAHRFWQLIEAGETVTAAVNKCLPPPTPLQKLLTRIKYRLTRP